MFNFEGKCPHCNSDRGFRAFGASGFKKFDEASDGVGTAPALLAKWREKYANNCLGWFSVAGQCQSCNKPVVAHVLAGDEERREIIKYLNDFDRVCQPRIEKIEIFPKPELPYRPKGLKNEAVADSFVEVQKMLAENYMPHNILMNCRTILENALAELGKTKNEHLYPAIERLYKEGKITECLYKWAHIIRDLGNQSVHAMTGTKDDAREMVEFIRIFLLYAFELPARIAEKQRKRGE